MTHSNTQEFRDADYETDDIPQGLREGSKLSPALFSLAINNLPAFLRSKSRQDRPIGIPPIREGAPQASSMLFADDVAIEASSPQEMQAMIAHMQEYCFGLRYSP